MVHLDTSALVGALTGPHDSINRLFELVDEGHRLTLSSIVLYEWLRGPRRMPELQAQEELFPSAAAVPFDAEAAARAAVLYEAVANPRGREADISIAACAIVRDAAIWTLNEDDFKDVPGLELV